MCRARRPHPLLLLAVLLGVTACGGGGTAPAAPVAAPTAVAGGAAADDDAPPGDDTLAEAEAAVMGEVPLLPGVVERSTHVERVETRDGGLVVLAMECDAPGMPILHLGVAGIEPGNHEGVIDPDPGGDTITVGVGEDGRGAQARGGRFDEALSYTVTFATIDDGLVVPVDGCGTAVAAGDASCAMTLAWVGEGERPGTGFAGVVEGTASFSSAEYTLGEQAPGAVQLFTGVDDAPHVGGIVLSDQDPLFAQMQLRPEAGDLPVGETGTFVVHAGGSLHADTDTAWEVGGPVELEITRNEVAEHDTGTTVVTVLEGSFRNVEPFEFDNPFPENGTRATFTEVSGTFRLDREACGGAML